MIQEGNNHEQGELVPTVLKIAVNETTRLIHDLSIADEKQFDELIRSLSPRTFSAIKKMTKILYDAGAETKIVDEGRELLLSNSATTVLNERLTLLDVHEAEEIQVGMLLGVFPHRRQYEFQPREGEVFHGPVSDAFDQRYITDPTFARSVLLNPVQAKFSVSTVVRRGTIQKIERTLLDVTSGEALPPPRP